MGDITEDIEAALADESAGPGWDETTLTWCAGFLAERFDEFSRANADGPGSETRRVSMMIRWVRWARLVMVAWTRDRELLRKALVEVQTLRALQARLALPEGHLLAEALTELRGIASSYSSSGDDDEAYSTGVVLFAIEALERAYSDLLASV